MWRRATHQSCLSIIVINLIIIRPIRTYVRQTFTECTCADLMSLFGNDRWTDYAKVRTSSMPMCSLNSQVYAPPNEDFRRRNKRWNANFEGSTFQWFVAQIEYSRPWNVLPSKSAFHLLFLLSKSSFGEHKCTNQACYLVEAIVVTSLQNPAWVFRGDVVFHMDRSVTWW